MAKGFWCLKRFPNYVQWWEWTHVSWLCGHSRNISVGRNWKKYIQIAVSWLKHRQESDCFKGIWRAKNQHILIWWIHHSGVVMDWMKQGRTVRLRFDKPSIISFKTQTTIIMTVFVLRDVLMSILWHHSFPNSFYHSENLSWPTT